MTPPPAKRAKHHHDPRLMHQRFIRQHLVPRLLLRHPRHHAREIIPIKMGAFGDPVAHPARVVARFVLAHVLRRVAPVVHRVDEMGFDELGVADPVVALEAEEVFGGLVVVVVDRFEEFEVAVVALGVG